MIIYHLGAFWGSAILLSELPSEFRADFPDDEATPTLYCAVSLKIYILGTGQKSFGAQCCDILSCNYRKQVVL